MGRQVEIKRIMEKILDRFLRYVSVDTQSNEESETQPSAAKEWDLLRMLEAELKALRESELWRTGAAVRKLRPEEIDR